MQHKQTLSALAVIGSSLLAVSAFAGQPKYATDRAQAAKLAVQAQHIDVAGGPQQTAAARELPRPDCSLSLTVKRPHRTG